jgi:hypothetical protein
METHQIDIAFVDGGASWCSCVCGWVSEKCAEDDAQSSFAAHVVERAFSSTPTL